MEAVEGGSFLSFSPVSVQLLVRVSALVVRANACDGRFGGLPASLASMHCVVHTKPLL